MGVPLPMQEAKAMASAPRSTSRRARKGARLPGQPPQFVKPISSMGSEMFWKAPSWAASRRKSVVPGQ